MINAIVNHFTPTRRTSASIEADLAEPTAGLAALDAEYAAACLDAADGVSGAEERKRKIVQQKDNLTRRAHDLELALQGARKREEHEADALAAAQAREAREEAQRVVRTALDARQRNAARLLATIEPFVKAYRALAESNGATFAAVNAGSSASGVDLDGALLRWDAVVNLIRGEMFRAGLDWDEGRFRGQDVPDFMLRITEATDMLRVQAGVAQES
jgi:hypothetical protein